jgi:hypothetical protein
MHFAKKKMITKVTSREACIEFLKIDQTENRIFVNGG